MDKRIVFSVLTSIFLISAISLIFIQPASSGYYEADDGWYGDAFWDEYDWPVSDQNNYDESNEVLIEFKEDGSYGIDVPPSDNPYDLADQLYGCINNQTFDSNANITTLKNELEEICRNNGIANPKITLTSPYGDDTFIYKSRTEGISMYPTIKSGQIVTINKTHDVHVGDLVAANYPCPHGGIIKRVAEIKGDELYLISDNVKGSYVKNGEVYEYEGIRTWVNMSDIQGVVIDIQDKDVFLV